MTRHERTPSEEQEMESSSAPLVEHLVELRRRLIYTVLTLLVLFFFFFFFAKDIFNILVWPYERAAGSAVDLRMIYTAPQEFFIVQIKLAFFAALFTAFPVIATQVYGFVAPGLYRNEKRAFLPFLIATPVLFLLGASLVYFLLFPMVMHFFMSMQQAGGGGQAAIELLPRVSEYLGLIMMLIFAFGLVFQLPVVLTLLVVAGILDVETLVRMRRYAIVAAFVAAAVLTPPDPLSQIGLALPTVLLYELSILTARYLTRRKAAAAQPGTSVTTS